MSITVYLSSSIPHPGLMPERLGEVTDFRQTDHAYECFCSVEDLAAARVAWKGEGAYFNYDGRCRHLTDEERARRKKAGHKYVVRWKVGTTAASTSLAMARTVTR